MSKHLPEWSFSLSFNAFSLSFNIIISIMTRDIEIEISNQSNIIFLKLLKEKKQTVKKLIDDLSASSSNYISISISYRQLMSHEDLRDRSQTSFLLFQLFFFFSLLQIMTNNINIKISLKRSKVTKHVKDWTNNTTSEIETFIEILLYMSIFSMFKVTDYWNFDFNKAIHVLIINCMSCYRWQQIKRFLKIFNFINDQKVDTQDSH